MLWLALLLTVQDAPPRLLLEWGSKGGRDGEFHSPIGLAIDAKERLLVTDCNNGRLQAFGLDGKHLATVALPWDDPKKPQCLAGALAVDGQGRIYVAYMNQHKVRVHEADGAVVAEWGRKGAAPGEFNQPGGIVLLPDGHAIVADQGNHRLQKFTREGAFVAAWGGHGCLPGEFGGTERPGSRFAGPHLLGLGPDGRLWTTEGSSGRIQGLSPEGRPLVQWGHKGDGPGGFGSLKTPYGGNTFGPIGIFADRHGRIWVSSLNDRVQCFAPDGRFLMGLDGFARPHGMAFDRAGHLYVADSGHQRIRKFQVPSP
jgi:sugar lactone lactonase YvrE